MKPEKPQERRRTGGTKRKPAQREHDLVFVSKMMLDGKMQTEIGAWINANRPYKLSLPQICYDCKAVIERWRADASRNIDELRARDLARLLDIETRATEAYQRSLLPAEKTTQERTNEGRKPSGKSKAKREPARTRVSVTKETRDGDPRWLEVILKCISERKEILGYIAPKKLHIGGEDGGPVRLGVDITAALDLAYGNNNSEGKGGGVVATVRPNSAPDWRNPPAT